MKTRVAWFALLLTVLLLASVAQAQRMNSGWYWPTGSGNFCGYLGWLGYNSGWGYHLAQDMCNSAGSPVYSVGNGTVISSGEHGGYGCNGSCNGGCVLARYQSADGTWFTAMYGHLYNYVGTGSVSAGQVIGYTRSDWSPPHLHFTIHPGYDQEPTNPWRGYTTSTSTLYGYVDPMPFLNAHPSGAVPSQPNVCESNVFSIDNNAGWTGPLPLSATAQSPYSNGATAYLLQGQLHCHKRSDIAGAIGEAELAQRYRNLGFDFVADTDHNEVSGESIGWQGWAPHSDEITYNEGHVLAVGTNAANHSQLSAGSFSQDKVGRLAKRINNVHDYAGLAFLAHPDGPGAVSSHEICTIFDRSWLYGVAVYNSSWPGANSEAKWDQVLRTGRRIWGHAEEDYHAYMPGVHRLHSAWVAVPGSEGEWWGNIKEQLRSGNYYSYWVEGGAWTESYDPPRLKVTTSMSGGYPVVTAALTDAWGNPYSAGIFFKTRNAYGGGTGSSRPLQCNGTEGYVRVRVVKDLGGGRRLNIASQPIWIVPAGQGAAVMQSSRNRVASTSPELHLRYLDPAEMPSEFPPAGYIGPAFEVTTDDGQVPPGATLELSFDGENTSAVGGLQYLAVYRYDAGSSTWVSARGTVNSESKTIETIIDTLGIYTISADLPDDTTAPQVSIDNPPPGGILNIDPTLRATTSDDLGAWRVSFYLNDRLVAEDADPSDGWAAAINTADYCEGDYTLKAVAEDLAGNTGTTEIPIHIHSSTPPPTVTISNPANGLTLTGTATATGTCGDDVAVASVALKVGDTLAGYATVDGSNWTCDIDSTYLVDGPRTLTATVEDYPGNQASASVNVTISNGGASVIGSIRTLADGAAAKFANAIVTAGTDLISGAFYAESPDRTSGIKVLTDQTVLAGDIVSVSGSVTTQGTEKMLQAYDIAVASHGNALPAPIGIGVAKLTGQGLDQIGKNIKVWGLVTSSNAQERWFVIDGGADHSIKCFVPVGVTPPSTGFVEVVGACSVDQTTGSPILIVRAAGDIRTP